MVPVYTKIAFRANIFPRSTGKAYTLPRPMKRTPSQRQRQLPQQPAAQQVPQSLDDFQLPPELQKMFDQNKPKF